MLAACAHPNAAAPTGDTVQVTRPIADHYQRYLATIGVTRPGAFAISTSGKRAFFSYCPETICVAGTSYGQLALRGCDRQGDPCYILAHGRDALYQVEILPADNAATAVSTDQLGETAAGPRNQTLGN